MVDASKVVVRVYNVGFGDSILIDLPKPDGERAKILIDCGSISYGDTGADTESVVKRIIDDVTDGGVPRIDVVVATHRHRDHVGGFGRAEWADVEVGEVWQPWTEDPGDPDARALHAAQQRLAQAIVDDAPRLAADDRFEPEVAELINAMGANALSNAGALRTLRTGFRGDPVRRYLARRARPRTPRVLGRRPVHVLGPPHDVDTIRRMDPPSDQAYLALLGIAADSDAAGDPAGDRPFPWLPRMDWKAYGQYGREPGDARRIDHGGPKGRLKDLVANDTLLSAAVLDHALNNTSLMLTFEVGHQLLLFPGDAQWGAWEMAMESSWSRDVLARTTFYKIGHHGSHNATPRRFVEEIMPDNFWAIASVAPYSQWTRIPKQELMDELAERSPTRVFTTMNPPDAPPPEVTVGDGAGFIEFTLDIGA